MGDLVCTLKMKYAILFLEIYTPLTILLSAYIDVMRDSKETCFLSQLSWPTKQRQNICERRNQLFKMSYLAY